MTLFEEIKQAGIPYDHHWTPGRGASVDRYSVCV